MFSDVIVRQSDCDGFVLKTKGPFARFFSQHDHERKIKEADSRLYVHFAKIERKFYLQTSSEEWGAILRKTTFYVLPGEKKPILKCVPNIGPKFEAQKQPNGKFKPVKTGYELKTYTLQLLGGNASIRKLLELDPNFLSILFSRLIIEKPFFSVQRFDVNADFNTVAIPQILRSIKANHYNSYKKGIYVVPDHEKGRKSRTKTEDDSKKEDFSKAIQLTKNDGLKTILTPEIESKTNTIYVGNSKRSEVLVCIWNKQQQSGSVKKSFS